MSSVASDASSVDGQVFVDTMARVAGPVAVVTAIDTDGPHGTTVSAFTSLSVSPPMALVSLDRSSVLLEMVTRTGRFGVNVLGSGQHDRASRFARKGRDGFAGIEWSIHEELPRLPGTAAWLACEVVSIVDGGDHRIVLGAVRAAEPGTAQPLTYHMRTFGTHRPV